MKQLVIFLFFMILLSCNKDDDDLNQTVQIRTGETLPVWMLESTTIWDYQNKDKNVQIGFNVDSISRIELKRNDRLKTKNYGPKKPGSSHDLSITFKDGTNYIDEVWYKDTLSYISYIPTHDNQFNNVANFIKYDLSKDNMKYYDVQFKKWKTKYGYYIESKSIKYFDYVPGLNSNQKFYIMSHLW